MNSIHEEFIDANPLFKEYIKKNKKFVNRYTALYDSMTEFIHSLDFDNKAYVNKYALGFALLDYFEDIDRLKRFHNINHVNSIKIISYISFWLLKRNVIQAREDDIDLLYINEKFIFSYIMEFLSAKGKTRVLERDNLGLVAFENTLMYHLKYRSISANGLEIMIIAFFAGEIYQSEDEDLSSRLTLYDDPHKEPSE